MDNAPQIRSARSSRSARTSFFRRAGRIASRGVGVLLGLCAVSLLVFGQRPTSYRLPDGRPVRNRIVVTYWEKWTRFEARAMGHIVNRFNRSQNHIFVHYVSVSDINIKTLVSIAGHDPPDIAGLWAAQMGPFISYHALYPLDHLLKTGVVTPHTYAPYLWKTCAPFGRLYALPSTPATCALFWNKILFARAGLDPNKPPTSIHQLDVMAAKLTVFDKAGNIVQAGFLPTQPGWWNYYWGTYFGNHLYNWKTGGYRIDTPQQIAAYRWVQSFAKKLGQRAVNSFESGFGQFNSPTNPFMTGRLAMEEQGPYFANFIDRNNPSLIGHYGVAPFPTANGKPDSAIVGDSDVWVIPRGARHPHAAMKALAFFSQQRNLEYLCRRQSKPSPLMKVSPGFMRHHPNPYIGVFERQMRSHNVQAQPPSPIWARVMDQLDGAADRIWLGAPVRATLEAKQRLIDRLVRENKAVLARRAAQRRAAAATH